ncbi:MAG TPA: hypothetical protein VGA36_06860 [Nitriliruptorales bacterium]
MSEIPGRRHLSRHVGWWLARAAARRTAAAAAKHPYAWLAMTVVVGSLLLVAIPIGLTMSAAATTPPAAVAAPAPMPGGDAPAVPIATLTGHPNFSASPAVLADLDAGIVDARVVALLYAIVQRHTIHAGVIRTGHSQCVGGGSLEQHPMCTESHHWYARAVDIGLVDGRPVSAANPSARALVAWLATAAAEHPLRPAEVGSPFVEFDRLPGFWADGDHGSHIHLGYCGPRWSRGQWEATSC